MKSIALITPNINQYSETFIHKQIELLPYDLHVFYGGHLPNKIKYKNEELTLFGEDENLEKEIKKEFKARGITAVLAQYGPSGVALQGVCQQLNVPLHVHFHGYDACRKDVLDYYSSKYKSLFKQAATMIVVSEEMKEALLKLGCKKGKISLVNYGVDFNTFTSAIKADSEKIKFIMCGRLVNKKGHHYLLQAFHTLQNQITNVELILIGDGPLKEELQCYIEEHGIKDLVHFAGVCTPEEVLAYLQGAHVYVQHSVEAPNGDKEGKPLAILEAMSVGLPIISTLHAGIPDVVEDNISGFLVKERDVVDMADKMLILAKDLKLRKSFGEAGRQKILKSHGIDQYISDLINIIEGNSRE